MTVVNYKICFDIRSNGLYPSNVLSNMCDNAFVIDGVQCGSMEGFLQSLKCQDTVRQRLILYFCKMFGRLNYYHYFCINDRFAVIFCSILTLRVKQFFKNKYGNIKPTA